MYFRKREGNGKFYFGGSRCNFTASPTVLSFFSVFVGDLNAKFFFEGHDQLYDV